MSAQLRIAQTEIKVGIFVIIMGLLEVTFVLRDGLWVLAVFEELVTPIFLWFDHFTYKIMAADRIISSRDF